MSDLGRPSKYKEEYVELAYNYCLMGATDAQLAVFFDVDESTITRWKNEHQDFCTSIKKGKMQSDLEIVKSLRGRARGMKLKKQVLKDGEIFELEDEIAPDTAAAIFWLKNRMPKEWRDKQETEHSGSVQVTQQLGTMIDQLSDDDQF